MFPCQAVDRTVMTVSVFPCQAVDRTAMTVSVFPCQAVDHTVMTVSLFPCQAVARTVMTVFVFPCQAVDRTVMTVSVFPCQAVDCTVMTVSVFPCQAVDRTVMTVSVFPCQAVDRTVMTVSVFPCQAVDRTVMTVSVFPCQAVDRPVMTVSVFPCQAVDRTMVTECRCHGVSGSCAVKTCWRSLAPFQRVGALLKERFEASVEVRQRLAAGGLKVRRKDKLARQVPVARDALVHLHKSPNYCVADAQRGILGTRGRHCSRSSRGPDGCNLLCCGRGYNTRLVRHVERCDCKFVWCCYVRCRRCESMNDMHTCK